MPSVALDDDLLERLHAVPAGEPVTFVSKSDPTDRLTVYITPIPRPPQEPDVQIGGGGGYEVTFDPPGAAAVEGLPEEGAGR